MKHGLKQRKLNRTSSHRLALLKNLSISLIKHETITTTTEKAKELRPFIEKLITKAKNDNLSNRKYILAKLFNNKEKPTLLTPPCRCLNSNIYTIQKNGVLYLSLKINPSSYRAYRG